MFSFMSYLFSILGSEADLEPAASLSAQRCWDFVILQENSTIPRAESDLRERMVPAAHALDTRIRENGAQTILYMTWASLDTLAGSGIEGFVDEQEQVDAGFLTVAEELNATVAPVGAAWARSLTQRQDLGLWQYDNVHANESGTYLAACVFMPSSTGKAPQAWTIQPGCQTIQPVPATHRRRDRLD
jgi:hypothetical protein